MNARQVDRAALAGLAGYAALLLHEVVLQGRVFFERDIQLLWYGQVQSFVRAVASGSWPLWDPYVAFGHPMLANANVQVLYPFTWLNLLVRPGPFYTLYAFAHLALGAAGAYRLARHLNLGPLGALCAALVWAGSGPFLSLLNVWNHFAGASLIPWALLAMERTLEQPRPGRAAAWGLVLGLQVLAGSPDMSLMTGGVCALRVALALGRSGGARRVLAASGLAALLGLAIGAGQWLPTLELARQGSRMHLDPAVRTAWSVPPAGLPQILTPVAWTQLPLSDGARRVLFDGGHPLLRSLYLGLVALPLVLAGALGGARWRVVALVLGGLALLYAMGPATPVYGLATTLAPPLRLMRFPSKAMAFVALAWALLAGLGLDAILGGRGRRWAAAAATGAAACSGLLAALAWHPGLRLAATLVPPEVLGQPLESVLRPAALALALAAVLAAAAALLLASGLRSTAAAPALVTLAALDLLAGHWRLHGTVPPEFYRFRPPVLDLLAGEPLPRLYVYRYEMFGSDGAAALGGRNPYRLARYPEALGFDGGRALAARLYLLPPVGAAFGVQGSLDPDLLGLYPRNLAELVAAHRALEGTPGWLRLLQVGAVPYVEALHDPAPGALVPVAVYESLLAEPIRAFAVPGALPRASFVSGARIATGDEALRTLVDPGFDPSREVVLAEGEPSPARAPGTAHITDYRADRVHIASDAAGAGYVVLADTFTPDWTATVDGRSAPVWRANVAFRAVPVPAGRHEVVMRYRPRSALWGMALTAAGMAAAALLAKRTWCARPGLARPA